MNLGERYLYYCVEMSQVLRPSNEFFKILQEDSRLTTFPIIRKSLWDYYEDASRSYWTPAELSVSTDKIHYETRLTPGEKRFVKHILAFFAASDGIVNLNIVKRFRKDVPFYEAKVFYDFQIMMENIHAHTYSMLLDEIVPSKTERELLLNAIQTMPIIKKMSDYMFDTINSKESFPVRLLRMACVEGIFFSGCFCAIYWLQNRQLMPALGHSNELIARDEGLHTVFALLLYTMILPELKLTVETVHRIFRDAVKLASEFINEALPTGLSEMNAELMLKYIECQADNLVTLIDIPPIYNSKNPFPFMEQINLINRTNFFERRVSEYAKAKITKDDGGLDDDF